MCTDNSHKDSCEIASNLPANNPILVEGDPVSSESLEEGLPAEEVHRRALGARKKLARAQRAVSFWLVEIERREIFRHFGCSSVFHYAESYLELAPHTIAECLRSGKEMARFPRLAAACEKGEISPSKIREISRVVTPETQEAWLSIALSSTYRQIEKLVPLTPKGGLPPVADLGTNKPSLTAKSSQPRQDESSSVKTVIGEATGPQQESPAPAASGTQIEIRAPERYRTKLILEIENDRMAILERAFEKARKETGEKERGALIEHIARAYIENESPGRGDGSPYRITLHSIPESKVAWIEAVAGPKYVPESTLEEALCDAEILDLREAPSIQKTTEDNAQCSHGAEGCDAQSICEKSSHETCPDHAHDVCRGECLNESELRDLPGRPAGRDRVIDPERHGPRLRRTIPRTLRRKVLARDGGQCTCPGCKNKRFLSLHHIDAVIEGGKDRASNLTTACARCHRALHKGLLSVEGRAPGALVWKNRWGTVLKGS